MINLPALVLDALNFVVGAEWAKNRGVE